MRWPLVNLEEVAHIEMGQAPTGDTYNTDNIGLPLIAGAGDFGEITPCATRYTSNPSKSSKAGDIIVCIRATIGDLNLSDREYCLGRGVAGLRAKPGRTDQRYLWRAMEASAQKLRAKGRGATFLQVSKNDIASVEIPLPPLEEQKRIAAILDQADALRRLRARALDRLNALGQAIFHEMFGDLATNSRDWNEGPFLRDVADIASGVTKGRKIGNALTRAIPYMAVSNVQDQHLVMDVVKTIDATEEEILRYRLQKGDLLLTEGGDPDKLGRGSLWNEELPECIHQNHVFRVRIKSDCIRPLFLKWQVSSPRGKQYFLRSAKQTTGIASINKSQLGSLPLLMPPVDLQLVFERRLNALALATKSADDAVTKGDSLFSSLQHRAFRGEL